MKRGFRMYIYVTWFAVTILFAQSLASGSGSGAASVSSYFSTSSNHSNRSCPKNCSEVDFDPKPIGINFEHVEIYILVTIFILIAILAKLVWHLAKLEKFTSNFPESCMLIIIGIIFGYLFLGISVAANKPEYIREISFTPTLFFLVLLPPIVLEAGYFMNNRSLYENALTIALLAFVNTIWNAFGLGMVLYGFSKVPSPMGGFIVSSRLTIPSALLFGTFISAVDPVAVLVVFEEIHVNKLLHILVFGESLFNDAVTVVMFSVLLEFANVPLRGIVSHEPGGVDLQNSTGCVIGVDDVGYEWKHIFFAFLKFFIVNIGGVLIGIVVGYLTCFITRFTDHIRVLEPMLIFTMAYFAYLLAELFMLSGIISMIAVAITMKHYVEANISHKSHSVVKYGIKMFAVVSETVISLFIGLYTANLEILSKWDVGLTLITLVGITVFRVTGIFAISSFVNLYRVKKITFKDQFIMSYSGLRGAVAFGLALISFNGLGNITNEMELCSRDEIATRQHFVTTTLAVVFFTVFIQGSTVKYWMKLLHIKFDTQKDKTLSTTVHATAIDHILSGIEEITGSIGHHRVRDWWERFDARYLRKIFERYPEGRDEQIIHRFIAKQHQDANLGLEDLCVRHGHCKRKKLSHQSDTCEIAPTALSDVPECAQINPQTPAPISAAPDVADDRSTSHRNSYLFDNIYHLMHLSRAKREPHVRRRHKHLLFEKHDIHLHPHFFHKHKKTVSKKTQDKIIRSEMPDHCTQEPISHFHPGEENQINCLGIKGVKRWSTKQKTDFNKIDEMTLEETGVHSNIFSAATPDVPSNSPGQTTDSDAIARPTQIDIQEFSSDHANDEEPHTPLLSHSIAPKVVSPVKLP